MKCLADCYFLEMKQDVSAVNMNKWTRETLKKKKKRYETVK